MNDNGKILSLVLKYSGAPTIIDAVNALELESLKHEQVKCPVYHHFSPGLYIRELNMPADTIAIGHYQKTEHLNIFLKGEVSIINDDGSVSFLKAPMIFTAKPGRKCGYVHKEVVWLNVYPTDETDIETLENTFLDKSENWKNNQVIRAKRIQDQVDFKNVLREYGYSEELVRKQSEEKTDQIPFPFGVYNVAVFESQIHGKGLFATADIKAGEIICPMRINQKRTPAGRYVNHAKHPNAYPKQISGDIFLVANSCIAGCCGGMPGDEITINYRQSLKLNGVIPCQE